MKDPKIIARKQVDRLKGATAAMEEGVKNVTRNPAEEAIKKKDKMRANILRAIDNGTWEAGLRSVTLEGWKQDMLTRGIPRVGEGAEQSIGKIEEFHTQQQAYLESYLPNLRAMPDLTLQDNINRAVANIQAMSKFRFKK